jgi:1,4-alpha-glucan branching enzyme
VLAFARHTPDRQEVVSVVCNFTPVVRHDYRIPVLQPGTYREILNTDAEVYGGSGVSSGETLVAGANPWQGQPYSLALTLPPLAVVYYKWQSAEGDAEARA